MKTDNSLEQDGQGDRLRSSLVNKLLGSPTSQNVQLNNTQRSIIPNYNPQFISKEETIINLDISKTILTKTEINDEIENEFIINFEDLKKMEHEKLYDRSLGVSDFRMNFLRKLSYLNIWVPNARKPPSHQSVIIFDWDDTLLCTTHLMTYYPDKPSNSLQEQLKIISSAGKSLIDLALKLTNNVFIITNAAEGWVEHSANEYLPTIVPVLQKVKIISARRLYSKVFPTDCSLWKLYAFLEIKRILYSDSVTNLLSIGDSNLEIDAINNMSKEFQQSIVKTVKLRDAPKANELAKQLLLLNDHLETIWLSPKNLKIALEKKKNEKKSEKVSEDEDSSSGNEKKKKNKKNNKKIEPSATGDASLLLMKNENI